MDYYCENCHLLGGEDRCLACGRKNLRAPSEKDFCYLTEVDSMFGEMFKGILEDENIPYVDYPVGNGVRSAFALKLGKLRIFVVYKFFEKAKELLNDILSHFENELRKDLTKNIDKLFVLPKVEKKIKKNLELSQTDDLIAYCTDRILNADRIVNNGAISACINGSEHLFIYKDNHCFIVNSATYQLLFAERKV